jgi:hypothetical protein
MKCRTATEGLSFPLSSLSPPTLHRYNEKVDVFSFAIVAWGLLTGAQVYRGLNQFEVPSRVCRAGLR